MPRGGDGLSTEKYPRHVEKYMLPGIVQICIATGGALVVGVVYLILPGELAIKPNWLPLLAEGLLLAPPLLSLLFARRLLPFSVARSLALTALAILTLALVISIARLINYLPHATAGQILHAAVPLWIMNVLVFAVWYWEFDGGGQHRRKLRGHQATDFRFPQQEDGNSTGWVPGFVDYLFLAFCTATALSPADTVPLTRRAKLLMMAEAVISLLILVVLVARSVNII
jgi:uncharacterized membrane protein